MLVEWLQADGHTAEYQWLRWEPSIVPLIKSIKSRLKRKSNIPLEEVADSRKAQEDIAHTKWDNIKEKLFASGIFKRLWLYYATKDYYRAYKKAIRSWNADYIVMDRYILDFIIDQSLNYDANPNEFAKRIEGTPVGQMRKPDLSILIDIPAEVGYQRKLDGTPLEYLKARRDCYLQTPFLENTLHVNGNESVEKIHNTIRNWVNEHQPGISS